MALGTTGVEKWAAGIRHRMANDPGRQDLDDHILCNGFLFLDEYLEDILLGTRPIIELTKTPGRRKDASKKDRVATAASVKTLQSPEKENVPVLQSPTRAKKAPTSFQKALLKASQENPPLSFSQIQDCLDADHPQNPFGHEMVMVRNADDKHEEEAVAVLITPPPTSRIAAATECKASALLPPLLANGITKPSDSDFGPPSTCSPTVANPGVELSVIAEGDESEMSQGSLLSTRPTGPIIRDNEIPYHISADPNNPNGAMSTVTVSYQLNAADDEDDTQTFPSAFNRTFTTDSDPTSTANSFPIDPYARDYESDELPQIVAEHVPTELPHSHSPPPTLIRKASVPVFPSLPGPSALHKSTRDSGVGSARPSAVTGPVTGTQSSWLNKARDVTAKRASGVKRKTGDLSVDTDYTIAMEGYARATKVAKTHADGEVFDALSDKEKPHGKFAIQPFKAIVPAKTKEQSHEFSVAHVAIPDGNSEGMMNILKRTLEGLGARVGKSMGKSLGGAAATAAAAEAKAAAEARLAEREAKGSDGTRQGRLSVSDLVGAFENGGVGTEQEPSHSKLQALPSPPVHPAPVNSALGGSKRSKPEPVKSIQLAAAAAKKQQEEADRKAARLREMDKRRAAIASKKADQDAAEKSKQQGDRHKREREEGPERNVKPTVKKVEEEVTKKRKVVVEIEKKPQSKNPSSKDKKEGSSRIGKPALTTSLSQSQLASNSMSRSFKPPGLPASASQPSVKLVPSNQGESKSAASLKAGKPINGLEDVCQPLQTLHAQMQARVQAQMLQARQEGPPIRSESIELPDINSEYSNSDDEDRPRTFDPPDWAQSPVLGLALQSQSRLNPDDIFGPVRPLRMEEIFTTRHSRFRARTSSANWAGTDELTTDEQREYAKRMGYLD